MDTDLTGHACRAAIWISLLEAQRAEWPDVVADLYDLHARVVERVRQGDYTQWRRQLDAEGPHQPEREGVVP